MRPAATLAIKVTADTGNATRGMSDVQRKLADTAAVAKKATSLKFQVQTGELDREIVAAKRKLSDLDKAQADPKVKLDDTEFKSQRRDIIRQIKELGLQKAEITADAKTARAREQLDSLTRDRTVEVKVDVDQSMLDRVKSALSGIGGSDSSGFSGLTFGLANLKSAAIAAAVVLSPQLVGALGALAASALQAAMGVGALAVGGGAAGAVGIAGIAAVAIPAISSLKTLMTAMDAVRQGQATGAQSAARAQQAAAQQIKTSNQAIVSANQSVQAAEQQLQGAQVNERVAQQALTQARLDAVRQLQDMKRAADEAGTSEASARLGLEQALQTLNKDRKLLAQGKISSLQYREAVLAVTQARQNLTDTTIQGNRAQQDYQKAQDGGVSKMPQVVAAQRALANAQQNVVTAQQGVQRALQGVTQATQNLAFQQKQASTAAKAGATQQAQLNYAQKQAGPLATAFAKNLETLTEKWKDLTKGAQANFFGMLGDGLTRVNQLLPAFAQSATSSTAALSKGFQAFLDQATGPGFTHFINVMTGVFSKSMVPLGDAFGRIGKILERIAVAAAPDVIRMVNAFDGLVRGFTTSTKNAGQLRDKIHGYVEQARAWFNLFKATATLIFDTLSHGAGQGKKAIRELTGQIHQWDAWVKGHPESIKNFFKQGLNTVKNLAEILGGFIPTLMQLSRAMAPITSGIVSILKWLNSLKVGPVSALTVLLGAFLAGSLASKIVAIASGIGTLVSGLIAAGPALIAAAPEILAVAAAIIALYEAIKHWKDIEHALHQMFGDPSMVVHGDELTSALDAIKGKWGSLANAAKHGSAQAKQNLIELAQQALTSGAITQQQFNHIAGAMGAMATKVQSGQQKASGAMSKGASSIKGSSQGASNALDTIGSHAKTMASDTSHATNQASTAIGNQATAYERAAQRIKHALQQMGAPAGPSGPTPGSHGRGVPHAAKGGIVAGSGDSDTVPLHVGGRLMAKVKPGELVSVANPRATAALMAVNSAVPAMAQGGVVGKLGKNEYHGALGHLLGVITHLKPKKINRALAGFEARYGKLDLPSGITNAITAYNADANRADSMYQSAITLASDGSVNFGGKSATDWLDLEFFDLANLRNQLVGAEDYLDTANTKAQKMLAKLKSTLADLKSRLAGVEKVARALRRKRDALHARLATVMGQIQAEGGKRKPDKNRLAALRSQASGLRSQISGLPNLSGYQAQEIAFAKQIAALSGKSVSYDYGGPSPGTFAAPKKGLIDALTGHITDLTAGNLPGGGTVVDLLSTVQGYGPGGNIPLSSYPQSATDLINYLAGQGIGGQMLTVATELGGLLGQLTGGGTGTPTTDQQPLIDLLNQQLQASQQQTAVLSAQMPIFSNVIGSLPFAGGFATGGVVDAPVGQAMGAVVHGGEGVFTPEQMAAMGVGGDAYFTGDIYVGGEKIGSIVNQRLERAVGTARRRA